MEDQRRSGAGLTNPVNNSSITYPSHAQLGVNPGLAQGDQYPPGYRFKPRDQELISCYLLCKIRDRPLPRNGFLLTAAGYPLCVYLFNKKSTFVNPSWKDHDSAMGGNNDFGENDDDLFGLDNTVPPSTSSDDRNDHH
ncbi:hypothetical protein D5086_032158 [Populus alba]|uniref:Uncharacterized protein n=1 Tax=Populus alba TaxID=43335 RepID=A0ACC4AKJ9_POPAL